MHRYLKRSNDIVGFACPKQILFIWAIPWLYCSWMVFPIIFADWPWYSFFGICTLMGLLESFQKRNAYLRYRISKQGVENNRKKLSWEQIEQVTICRVRDCIGKRSFWIEFPSVLCFGLMNSFEFGKLDPSVCVFLPLTKKDLSALRQYADGRCPAIEKLYHEYYDYVK